MEDVLSNKDSSDEFIGQSPVGNIVNFAIKTCCHRLYTGCKGCRIIGVSGFLHKRRTRTFSVYRECAQLIMKAVMGCHPVFDRIISIRLRGSPFNITSVASFLVLGGGGGKTPKCTDKKNHVLILRERASASNIYFQDSQYICIHTINAVSFNNL